jgi:cation diffusion facilitator family transporter
LKKREDGKQGVAHATPFSINDRESRSSLHHEESTMMNKASLPAAPLSHSHVYLGAAHTKNERRMWAVISLCGAMTIAEIVGGLLFGSIALVADGLHMSTHAGALLLAALAYTYARRHADDPRFTFGTGKLGDLAGFTSGVILAMIALLIGYESVSRIFAPVQISFAEAIPIACLGLSVNVISAWLLSRGGHHHDHRHGDVDLPGHGHAGSEYAPDVEHCIATHAGIVALEIFEDHAPARFRLRSKSGPCPAGQTTTIETVRPNGIRQLFNMADRGGFLESIEIIPEPHAFTAFLRIADEEHSAAFEEHEHAHDAAHCDNNFRAAAIHVIGDAAVSVLVIAGLLFGRAFGWLWMDPLAGIIGALVIASWAIRLVRDTGAILLDMNPDQRMTESLRQTIESDGDQLADLHLWRLGPGHLGAIVSISAHAGRGRNYYRTKLSRFRSISHLTVEVVVRTGA